MKKEETNEYTDELEKIDLIGYLYEFLKAFRKFFWAILLILVLCTAGGCFWSWRSYQPVYEAYTSFVVTSSGQSYNSSYYDNTTAEQMGKTFPYILTSGVLKDVVREDLGYSFSSSIEATVMEGTNLFTITVRDRSAQTAYDVMTSVIENYPAVAEYIIGGTTLTVVDESGVPTTPANSGNMRQAGVAGLLVGAAISALFLALYLAGRKTIRSGEDMNSIASTKFLGNVPETRIKKRSSRKDQAMTITNSKVPPSFKEGIRLVRSRVEAELQGKECPVILVTSAVPEEGKTTVAVNLALALAQKKHRVILIDGDLRNPSVMQSLNLPKKKDGIVQVVQGQADLEKTLTEYKGISLKILPGTSKTSNPAAVIRSDVMKELIKTLKQQADFLIIDTPPSSVLSDAAMYEEVVDGAVMVVRQDFASTRQVQKGMETLADADIPVIGYVLNYMEEGTMGYGYSSYGKYGYGKYGYRRYGYGYGKYGYGRYGDGRHAEDEDRSSKSSETMKNNGKTSAKSTEARQSEPAD